MNSGISETPENADGQVRRASDIRSQGVLLPRADESPADASFGGFGDMLRLASLLHHPNPHVVAAAEDAMWSCWLCAGDARANKLVAEAICLMSQDRLSAAHQRLDTAIRRCPHFAEAFNQRAILLCLEDREAQSIRDSRRAIALNPLHFGAAVVLGNGCLALCLLDQAADAYQAALRIHPTHAGARRGLRWVQQLQKRESAVEAAPLRDFILQETDLLREAPWRGLGWR